MDKVTPPHADLWLDRIFAAKAAEGQIVRRNLHWVAREIGIERFQDAVRSRGFHLIRTGDQFVVVCHQGEIRLLF